MKTPKGLVSLDRALSKLGILSRTEANKAILEGRVVVNGVLRKNPSFKVRPETAKIVLDGKTEGAREHQTWIFYKPRGVVTTSSDEKGRKTVLSYFKHLDVHLGAVGRLDQATSGLLLVSNDTKLSSALLDPQNKIDKVYLVTVRGEITPEKCEKIEKGILDEGEKLRPESVIVRKVSGKETHLVVTLTEGKNREIRRIFSSLGHEVTKLKRVGFAGLELGEMEPGEMRKLSEKEVSVLRTIASKSRLT